MCPMPGICSALTHEVVEGSGDAHDLVNGPATGFDRDDEELAGHPGPPRLRRDRSETKAPRRIAVGEAGEHDALAVRREDEDLPLVAIGNEQMVARTQPDGGGDRSPIYDAGGSLRGHLNDLARSLLDGSFGGAVAADPKLVFVIDSEKARDSAADRVPREWWRLATSLR